MKKKTIFFVAGFILFLITLLLLFFIIFTNIKKDKEETIASMNYINDNYKILSDYVTKYNKMRNDYITVSKVLILDDYESVYGGFTAFMVDYNNLINDIGDIVKKIDTKCLQKYPDNDVNNKCGYYKNMYEKIINLYIGDIRNYNNFIKNYNEYKQAEVPFIELVYSDYIDYDSDGKFEGVGNNE